MITESQIKSALRAAPTCGKKSIELKDGGSRGEGRLALIVRAGESRITTEWYAVYYRGGKRTTTKMGSYPTYGIADARKLFREEYAPKISSGENPTGPRSRANKIGVTVLDLFQAYVAHLKANASPRSAVTARFILLGPPSRPGGAARAIGEDMRAADVRPADITPHLSEIHARGCVALAADTRTYISAAFAFVIKSANSYTQPAGATKWGIETNPVAAIPADPAGARIGDRHLSPSEFRAFWRWLEREDSNSAVAPALRLIMATGQRVTEILELTNTSYDRGERMLDWRKTKNGRQHSIPLPTQALSILDGLVVNRHGLFFPHGRRPDEPATIYSPPKVIYHYAEDTGAAPFTARDFRRTWKTLTGAAGLSKDIRDRLQNHARQDVSSRHYDRYEYLQEKRAAMATWSAYLDRILAGEFDKNAMKEAA